MIFKITPAANRFVQIAAVLQLLLIVLNITLSIGHLNYIKVNSLELYILGCVLAALIPLYVFSVLTFFGERKFITLAFLIYAVFQIILMANPLVTVMPPQIGVIFSYTLGVLVLAITLYVFVISLFVRNELVFAPVLLFSLVSLVVMVLQLLIPVILPLLDQRYFGSLNGVLKMRQIVNYVSGLFILRPVAIILLTRRVNQFIHSQQVPEV